MLALVLGEARWEGYQPVVDVVGAEVGDFRSALAEKDAEPDDRAEHPLPYPPYGRQLLIREYAAPWFGSRQPLDSEHGALVEQALTHAVHEEDFKRRLRAGLLPRPNAGELLG